MYARITIALLCWALPAHSTGQALIQPRVSTVNGTIVVAARDMLVEGENNTLLSMIGLAGSIEEEKSRAIQTEASLGSIVEANKVESTENITFEHLRAMDAEQGLRATLSEMQTMMEMMNRTIQSMQALVRFLCD